MLKAIVEPFLYPRRKLEEIKFESASRKKARAKNGRKTVYRLWSYLARHRLRIGIVLLMVLFTSTLSLLGPFLIGKTVDHYLIPHNMPGIWKILSALAAIYALHSILIWLQNYWMIGISQQTVLALRTDLFGYMHKLPIPYFDKKQFGELMSRVTNDIENVSSTLNSSVIQVFSSLLMLAGTISLMLWLSPLLTLLAFLIIPGMVFGMKWITRRTSRSFKEVQKNLGDMNSYVEETITGHRIVKTFSREQQVIERFREQNNKYKLSGFWAQTISGFIPKLMNALNNVSFAIIAGAGGLMAYHGFISIGTIIIFVEYSRQFTRPLHDLSNQFNTLLSAIAGAERVFEVLDEQMESKDERGARKVTTIRGEVIFHQVSFGYDSDKDTLSEITFRADPGQTVALVGPTGAGKTTLINLLARFYEADSGSITIDGTDIRALTRDSLRRQMAVVLQDSVLFSGTVRDNIRFGRLDATDDEVEEAGKLANAHSFITKLPHGYDTVIDQDGEGISQGQKQLLAIARAMLAKPSLLILDEATSNVDTVTEIKIQEALHRLMEGRTSFVIAHRLNTIRKADLILVLNGGRVVETGTHEQLIEKNGFYRELHNHFILNDSACSDSSVERRLMRQ